MMRLRLKQILFVTAIAGACQTQQTPQPMDVSAEVQAVNNQFSAAWTAQDARAVAALYTETAQLLPPNAEPVSGPPAIQQFMQNLFEAGLAGLELTTTEATGIDSLAIEVGRYRLMNAAGETLDEGKYMVWWRRTAAGWRLHRDIFNSNRPLPTSAP
jgi:uncharacterized protein (TIGR02246 family)